MKISKRTLSALSNLSGFNENILISEGSVLKTMTTQKNVFATIKVEETFPVEVPIYALSEFLKAAGLLDNPDFDFQDKFVDIKDADSKIRFFYADKSVLTYPQKEINFPAADVEFALPTAKFEKVLGAAKALNVPTVSLVGAGGKLSLVAHDPADKSSNKFELEIGNTDTKFQVNFKMEHLRLLGLDYDVSVSLKGIARFANAKEEVSYLIGLQVVKED